MVVLTRLVQAATGILLGLALAYGIHPGNLVLVVATIVAGLVLIAASKREGRLLPGWWATAAGTAAFFTAVGGPRQLPALAGLVVALAIGAFVEFGARRRVRPSTS